MTLGAFLKSETAAWAAGGALLAAVTALAAVILEWLGVGIVGLAGLTVTTNVALHGGHAVSGHGIAGDDVTLYALQKAEARKAQASPEEKMQAAAAHSKTQRRLYLLNTLFIAMAALGLGLFLLQNVSA